MNKRFLDDLAADGFTVARDALTLRTLASVGNAINWLAVLAQQARTCFGEHRTIVAAQDPEIAGRLSLRLHVRTAGEASERVEAESRIWRRLSAMLPPDVVETLVVTARPPTS